MGNTNSIRSSPFFRIRLLTSKAEEISKTLEQFKEESEALTKQITEICWYMRGSVTWDQAWNLSPNHRKAIFKLIEDNIDRTKKSGIALL